MNEHSITVFVGLLNSHWIPMQKLEDATGHEGLTADWAQASWEAIVEASLPRTTPPPRLVVYGDGADCHSGSSRASFPDDLPTCAIYCELANDVVIDYLSGDLMQRDGATYAFDRFVSVESGWYFERPPFDHVLLERDGRQYVAEQGAVTWTLSSCPRL